MKAWKTIGYTIDGEAFCTSCLDERFSKLKGEWAEKLMRMMDDCTPVFASDEHELACHDCNETLGK
jgi:hypothetical protein